MVFEFLKKNEEKIPTLTEMPQSTADPEALAEVRQRVEEHYESKKEVAPIDDPVAQAMASIKEEKAPGLKVPPSETKLPASFEEFPPQPRVRPPSSPSLQKGSQSPPQPTASSIGAEALSPRGGEVMHLTKMRQETQTPPTGPTLDERVNATPPTASTKVAEVVSGSNESGEDIIADTTDAIADFVKKNNAPHDTPSPDGPDQGGIEAEKISSSPPEPNVEVTEVATMESVPAEVPHGIRIKELLAEVPGDFEQDAVISVLRKISNNFSQLDMLLEGVYTKDGRLLSDALKEVLPTEARRESLRKALRQISANSNVPPSAMAP